MQLWALFGITIIIAAWLVQLFSTWHGHREIKQWFVFLYLVGVALLVVDGFVTGINNLAFANLIALLLSLAVFIRLLKPTIKNKPKPKFKKAVKTKKKVVKTKKTIRRTARKKE